MSCGCGNSSKSKKASSCGCGSPKPISGASIGSVWGAPTVPMGGDRAGERAGDRGGTGGPLGVRLSAPWTGSHGLASSERRRGASDRPVPIGVRPSVPEPAPFQVGSYLGAPGSIGQYLADLFSSSPRSIIEQAELALRRIPEARRAAVVGALLTVPSQFRLPELVRIAGMNGEIPPDLPGQSTAPTDPGITVTLTSQGAVRQVAPPPAPQQVCLVNGYDPRWGPPPPLYLGVALRFDLPTASYIFDKAWAITNSPRTRQGLPAWSAADFRRIETSYVRDGLTLQPFRRSISSPWEFRWVVLTNPPQIHCETA